MPASTTITPRRITLTLALTAVIVTGGVALTLPAPASAQVTMGSLSIDGDSASVSEAPSEIMITVAGEYDITAASPPEMTRVTLQVHVGGENQDVDDIASASAFDTTSGTYDINANLYDHDAVERGDLTPSQNGESRSTTLLVRIIVSAVSDGSVVAESHVQDTAVVEVTRDGITLSVGGTGSIAIS